MAAHSLFLSRLKPPQRLELEQRLLARQSGVCFLCEEPIDFQLQADMLEIDHIVPVASGGKDEENNFGLTHEACNRKKSASDLRVARVMMRFAKIEDSADAGQGANLGDVLKAYGGGTKPLRMIRDGSTVRYSIPSEGGAPIVTLPLWRDRLSEMEYFFAVLPLTYLHHDERINPRNIGANLRGLVEEFHQKRPQLHVALAWWNPEKGDEGNVNVFDGQHKAAAQILLGAKDLPVRVFLRPDLKVLLEANTNAGDKLRQVAFDSAVKRHLGSALYYERVQEYQHLRHLPPEDFSFSEADLVKLFRGEHRELIKYIVDAVRDSITRDANNKLMDFVQWAGKGYEKPLAYSSIEKTFYSQFLYMKPTDTPLNAGLEIGSNPRQLEKEQMIRLMSLFAEVFFAGQWDAEMGGFKLEDRVLKGEPIPPQHLRAWRIGREEVLANILDWVRFAIESFYAVNMEKVDKGRLMHHRFPEVLWGTLENVLRNIGDLPCWVDTKLAQTIFGGKPPRDFWKKIFKDGVSPTGIRVLAQGLELKSLVTPKGE
ncbi:MAG: HNH endonuclease [Candidatus Eisenbacteria bacterium]|nr:HNH endonuclease [Candidatus Eisenbacteria bacterium]